MWFDKSDNRSGLPNFIHTLLAFTASVASPVIFLFFFNLKAFLRSQIICVYYFKASDTKRPNPAPYFPVLLLKGHYSHLTFRAVSSGITTIFLSKILIPLMPDFSTLDIIHFTYYSR